MTREILFRAKQMSCRKWCEGYLVKDKTGCHIITPDVNIFHSDAEVYHVDENTICQYTGLTDKNGTKIFENDYINCRNEYVGKITWIDSCFIVEWEKPEWDYLRQDLAFWCWRREAEVIGNIFDNQTAEEGEI